ncbi:TolC family protein [Ancylomarina sp. DW003]|nr:TolC family protein [Ancylomarina sp. DW003]MDE5421601.1 TolC family protein [Ancylomarina sp. DW003]
MNIQKQYISICFYLFLLIAMPISGFGQSELGNYLEKAAENNPGLKAKFNDYLAALERGPQVKALPDPQVAFAYFIKPIETRMGPQEFKFSASQMFPWFGTLRAKENSAIGNAKAKYEAFEEEKAKLFHEVRTTYYNLYFNKKAITISLENIDILQSFRKMSEIKLEAGLVSALDGYRIEIEMGDIENQLALLKDKQFVLEVMFNNLLNSESKKEIWLPEELWRTDLMLSKEAILDSIQSNNHQLLSLSFQQEALGFKKEVAKKAGKPNINIGFDYILTGKGDMNLSGTDAFVFPKIGLTIPLYRNKYKAMVKEVVYLETAKEHEQLNKSNMLESLFEKGWKDYRDGERRIHLNHSQLELARKALHLLETNYATGNKNFEEILRMERKLLKYNLELEKAKADKQAAISFISYLMGK